MLAARGVSLGLGKINLADLHQLPTDRGRVGRLSKADVSDKKPRIIIRKQADKETVWAACRAVLFASIVILVGLAMSVLGYFDTHFSTRVEDVDGVNVTMVDPVVRYHLKSMQYVGPVLCGIGCFVLIIACVITLESRDKHAQVMHIEADGKTKKEAEEDTTGSRSALIHQVLEEESVSPEDVLVLNQMHQVRAEVHGHPSRLPLGFKTPIERPLRCPPGAAPIAAIDSLLDIVSSSSSQDRD